MKIPANYTSIQQKYTSSSRGTRMGRRVNKNVAELSKYLTTPVLCVGCGDGWEVEQLSYCLNIKENILGVEVTPDRVKIAKNKGLPVIEGCAENLLDIVGDKKYDIYCAHTLEHCFNKNVVIENFKKIALNRIVIVTPIELKGTRNRAHYSPIYNLGYIANCFGMDWKVVNLSYRWNVELEGLLVLEKNPMNWPSRLVGKRSSEVINKGKF